MSKGIDEPAVEHAGVPLEHIARQLKKRPRTDHGQEGDEQHPDQLVLDQMAEGASPPTAIVPMIQATLHTLSLS
jgi:hypothetical protein